MTKFDDRKIDWTGTVMNDKYILIKKLGCGSYASVWLSYDFTKQKYNAIKISNRRDVLTAINEVINYKSIQEIKSKYLIKPIEIFEHINNYYDDEETESEHNKHYCIVMELMGSSLYDVLKTQHYNKNIKFIDIINISRQILKGLSDLHEHNIIHGDIKPENILITNTENKFNKIKKLLELHKIKGKKKIIEHVMKKHSKLNTNSSSSPSSYSSDYSDDISRFSYFSSEYDKIELSDDEEDTDEEDYEEDEDDDGYNDEYEYDYSKLSIQIIDYGECQFPKNRKKREIQTCYYKSPELLLRLPYTTSSDMWAFGCTFIELLTQHIMFDADEYEGNNERHHLYLINCFFGDFPKSMICDSPKKDIYFTKDNTRIKGHSVINNENSINRLLDIIKIKYNLVDITDLTDFITNIFNYDQYSRLTAKDALNHNLFNKQ